MNSEPFATSRTETAKRFWALVRIGHPWECWPWQGGKDGSGYGRFHWSRRKMLGAHRVAFFLFKGKWPKNNALHDCDNPPCCNPFHIFDGTQHDNIRQSRERGRLMGSLPLRDKKRRRLR